jgi:hypothetical protein
MGFSVCSTILYERLDVANMHVWFRPFADEANECVMIRLNLRKLCMGADKSLAFLISSFPICSKTKRIFLGWVKEVRTTKS